MRKNLLNSLLEKMINNYYFVDGLNGNTTSLIFGYLFIYLVKRNEQVHRTFGKIYQQDAQR